METCPWIRTRTPHSLAAADATTHAHQTTPHTVRLPHRGGGRRQDRGGRRRAPAHGGVLVLLFLPALGVRLAGACLT